jgi:ATP-dependent DNA helicase RecG
MARMNLVENIGSGIKRIRDAVAAYGLKSPIIQAEEDWFSITLMRKGIHGAIKSPRRNGAQVTSSRMDRVEGVSGGVTEGLKSLLEFIQGTPGLRAPQISSAMEIPLMTFEHWIKQLRRRGAVEFRGSPKAGGYHRKHRELAE